MSDREGIKREGVKLLEEFSEKLRDIPDTAETHYVVDLRNVSRPDDKPVMKKGFRDKIRDNAPVFEEGYFVAEKAKK